MSEFNVGDRVQVSWGADTHARGGIGRIKRKHIYFDNVVVLDDDDSEAEWLLYDEELIPVDDIRDEGGES